MLPLLCDVMQDLHIFVTSSSAFRE